jgi:hypothetical protein
MFQGSFLRAKTQVGLSVDRDKNRKRTDPKMANVISVSPMKNSDETREWLIKGTERRTLPLTEDLAFLLLEHQNNPPEGFPYIFVPSDWRTALKRGPG